MDSLNSTNKETRPFYYLLFTRILQRADGALAEVVGSYALDYAQNYPAEFFGYLQKRTFKQFYPKWVSSMGYEILMAPHPKEEKEKFTQQLLTNCRNCPISVKQAIDELNLEIEKYLKENM